MWKSLLVKSDVLLLFVFVWILSMMLCLLLGFFGISFCLSCVLSFLILVVRVECFLVVILYSLLFLGRLVSILLVLVFFCIVLLYCWNSLMIGEILVRVMFVFWKFVWLVRVFGLESLMVSFLCVCLSFWSLFNMMVFWFLSLVSIEWVCVLV